MKISRFFGITTREAMRQVRLALGADALIVSNRRVAGGVEILATDSSSIEAVEGENPASSSDQSQPRPPLAAAQQPPSRPPLQQQALQPQRPHLPPSQYPQSFQSQPRPPQQPSAFQRPVASPQTASAPARKPSPMSPMGAYAAAVQAAYGLRSTETAQPPAAENVSPSPPSSSPAHPAVEIPSQAVPDEPFRPTALTPTVAQATSAAPTPPPAQSTPAQLSSTSAQPGSSAASTAAMSVRAAHPAPPSLPLTGRETAATGVESAMGAGAPAVAGITAAKDGEPDVMDAIGAMRGALETRIDELLWGNQLRSSPHAAHLFQTLLGQGFSTALLRSMLQRLPEGLSGRAAVQWARQELISSLPVMASEDELWRPGLALALVGPTGVGKTTTIAKLAARCVRRFGPDKLVLITTDTYRIGAHEQLKIYGNLLKTPVHVVRSAAELQEVISSLRADQIVLIDNVGISQRDRYITEQAAMLAAAGREVLRLLVLNAASHGETLDEVARRYTSDGGSPLRGCIITKVDEATRLGAVLDTVLRYRFPIHYVSIGQKVPEHLAFLPAEELVDQALTQLPASRSLYAPTEADFAALLAMSRATTQTAVTPAPELRQQHMQTLPRLLSMTGAGTANLTPDDLVKGCEWIEALTASSEAYALWKAYAAGTLSPEVSLRHLNRVVQSAWVESGQKYALAVHDQIALRTGPSAGQLRASLLLNEQGVPLASLDQQLSLADGWYTSDGQSAPRAPEPRHCLFRQLEALAGSLPELPLLHIFEGGSAALWRELSAQGARWLAHIPAITRLNMEDGATTAQALAKTLDYRPVPDPDYLFALSTLQGAPAGERALWVGSADVQITARGQETLSATLVAARLVDRNTGKLLKSVLGLHSGLDISAEKLAAWLVVEAESRDAMRYAAAGWAMLPASDGKASPVARGLVAAQLGLAAWQLGNGLQANDGRSISAIMLGKSRLLSSAVPAATLKLFALKDLMSAV